MTKRQKKFLIGAAVLLPVLLIIGLSVGPIMSQVEKPNYVLIRKTDNVEIRTYPPLLVAQVEVQGERKPSIEEGFRVLADYIFGNNVAEQEIAMTAPVQQELERNSQKISMTAPVMQQGDERTQTWLVRFMMPSKYTIKTIPQPVSERVELRELSGSTVAAIRFSGLNSDENIRKHEDELYRVLGEQGIEAISKATYAFYNPPFTLPLLRRNEVMVEIRKPADS